MTDSSDTTRIQSEETRLLLGAIGLVAVRWAKLEYEVNKLIWALTSTSDEDGACVTSQIPSMIARMRALIALVHLNGGGQSLIDDLNKFSAHADSLARRRNRIIHDPWFEEKDSPSKFGRLEITADRKLVFEVRPQTTEEVIEVVAAIEAATGNFKDFRRRVHEGLIQHAEKLAGMSPEDLEQYMAQKGPKIDKA